MCEGEKSGFMVRQYTFGKETGENEDGRSELVVFIPEILNSQYGTYVWPCAVVLAQYVWFHRRELTGKKILEIGAGVSLPGVVAAKCGGEVILSDSAELPQCLENCHQSCQMNGILEVPVIGLTWGNIAPDLLALPPLDIILGSDVFYEPEDFEDVLSSVYFLMQKSSQAQFWTSYQVRSTNWSIEDLLYKWDLKCTDVPLMTFDAHSPHLAGSDLPGRHTVKMMIITANNI
ncbi:histone-arginine methyltransferase METTL23 [Microcaecilia unicolor]|uniref:Methyltransferase-like protein 23 n=1 Tax=Microcaecilia unicolor TaxID=1415580 RepID=A0A6P7YLN7_9AMPH|nr:methyltransferase-like protein 23 [Microcaecilia unicolor]